MSEEKELIEMASKSGMETIDIIKIIYRIEKRSMLQYQKYYRNNVDLAYYPNIPSEQEKERIEFEDFYKQLFDKYSINN